MILTYDDLVSSLEDAWVAAGLHEHGFIESVIPTTHDRSCKIELFPEHAEPLGSDNMPPWLDLSFNWTAVHQLISEGRTLPNEPLDLTWTYTATIIGQAERSDAELVRIFQRAVQRAFERHYPNEAAEMELVAVEVRRFYITVEQRLQLEQIQLVSTTLSDIFEQMPERDLQTLRTLLRVELQLASTIIANLADSFTPRGRGGYRTVDAA